MDSINILCLPTPGYRVISMSFTILDSAQGVLTLANLVPNAGGNLFGINVWTDVNGVNPGFAAVQPSSAVPEPSTWAMMLLGFAGLGFAFRRSRRKVAMA
jgi:hypothetical protein